MNNPGITYLPHPEFCPKPVTLRLGRRAFSLVELLSVVAIIAVLAGILFPVAISVRRAVLTAKSRAQFRQYAAAIEQFRIEYGFYPDFGSSSADTDPLISLRGISEIFLQTLSGRKFDGGSIDHSYALAANKQRIPFYRFGQAEFASGTVPICGETIQKGELVDAFDNPNIFLVFDGDRNGVIEKQNLPPGSEDLHAAVAIYSLSSGNGSNGCQDWKTITTWD